MDDDGSIPHGIVELDPIEGAENEMNVLRKDLQTQLRKGKYDFRCAHHRAFA